MKINRESRKLELEEATFMDVPIGWGIIRIMVAVYSKVINIFMLVPIT